MGEEWKDYVLSILAAGFGVLATIWVGLLSYVARGQIKRIDTLEHDKANRMSTNDRFSDVLTRIDKSMERMDRHMDEDSIRFRELTEGLANGTQRLEDKIGVTNSALGATNKALGEVIGELRATRRSNRNGGGEA